MSYHEVPVYQQSMQQLDRNELHVCPYDESHRVAAKRFIRHIIKCRKNHPGADKSTCPFNARHIVPSPELQLHISTCPDRRLIENEINCQRLTIDGDEARGDVSVPSYSNNLDFSDNEDWDKEIAASETHPPSYRTNKTSMRYFWNEAAGDADSVVDEPTIPGLTVRRGAQTNQPFPAERRPSGLSQTRSAVVGMGRGRRINPDANLRQSKSREQSRPGPSGGASLAANFDIQPRNVDVRPSRPMPHGRSEAGNNIQSRNGQQLLSSIRQILEIERKIANGIPVSEEEKAALERKPELEARLERVSHETKWATRNGK